MKETFEIDKCICSGIEFIYYASNYRYVVSYPFLKENSGLTLTYFLINVIVHAVINSASLCVELDHNNFLLVFISCTTCLPLVSTMSRHFHLNAGLGEKYDRTKIKILTIEGAMRSCKKLLEVGSHKDGNIDDRRDNAFFKLCGLRRDKHVLTCPFVSVGEERTRETSTDATKLCTYSQSVGVEKQFRRHGDLEIYERNATKMEYLRPAGIQASGHFFLFCNIVCATVQISENY
uniref:Uncharacterized protein n=1 Tax=Glossina brevipalpis TaxID=37001 RepID=A0A1A9X5J5_9MUSC